MTIHNSPFIIHNSQFSHDDLLWRHLKTVPAFRALLRAVEARFYQHTEMPKPILDLGCGDGHFTQMTFNQPLTAGADPWWGPLQKSQKSGMYRHLAQSMGDHLPFPDNHFGTVISNSVLEHIPDIQAVLNDAGRVLQPGGKLIITMPSHLFTEQLGGAEFLEKLGANGLADRYRRFFNFVARHVHTDPPDVWAERLALAGFAVERWQYYFSREALHALEWGHVQGLPSAILHFLTGHWILSPWEDNLRRTERWVRPFYEEEFPTEGTYIFFVARKEAAGPIEASLPAARPFSVEELMINDQRLMIDDRELESVPAPEPSAVPELSEAETPEPTPAATPVNHQSSIINPRIIPAILVAASLLSAITGQAILNANPPEPIAGLRWYGYSLIPLFILAWRQRGVNWPGLPQITFTRPGKIPRHRWYYFLALFLAFLAPRIVNNPSSAPQPGLAIMLWLAAGGIAFYALSAFRPSLSALRFPLPASRFTLIAAAALFLTALIARAVNLTSHPFILNGVEASIGLDAQQVANGTAQNPFATGWLTNPTLLYFLLAGPLRLLGPSTLSIRLLSPLAGAFTVAATFLLGKRLWGRDVGLIAAVLLTGSHLHLHYSRLGMTNIWDPLLVLLALGLLALAWRESGRFLWLLAGTAVGLNAYVFTGSHLLPLMLVALAILVLLFDRETLWRQWRHILAAAALAFIIALPQIIYYNNNPAAFMDRVNALGILEGQTGWIGQEAARTGLSQGEILRDQFARAALSFNYSLDKSGAYRPERPLLGFGMAVLFVIGLAIAVARRRQFRYNILLVWVIIPVIFGGALLLESPSSHRLVVTTPALALLAAIGLVEMGRLMVEGRKRKAESGEAEEKPITTSAAPALLPVLLAIAMMLALLDINFYFGTYRQQHTFADRNTEIADGVANYLNSLNGNEWTAYFFGPPSMYVGFPTIPFLVEDFQSDRNLYDVNEPGEALLPAQTPNRTFIFLPERANEIERTKAMVANGRLQTIPGFHANPLFYIYEVGE